MNTNQKQQAEHLFFQTDLSKTEIAKFLGISRRTLHYWIKENNWERLKQSASVMPSLIAENAYYALAHFTESLLDESREYRPITKDEANTFCKMTLGINRLKSRATLPDNMEMFAYFMEEINADNAELGNQVRPYVNRFIAGRARLSPHQHRPFNFNDGCRIPRKPDINEEAKLDVAEAYQQAIEDGHITPPVPFPPTVPLPDQPQAVSQPQPVQSTVEFAPTKPGQHVQPMADIEQLDEDRLKAERAAILKKAEEILRRYGYVTTPAA